MLMGSSRTIIVDDDVFADDRSTGEKQWRPGWRASAIYPADQSALFRYLDFPDLMKESF
jgi:hypothetical protein